MARDLALDRYKGLLIVLVVLGHAVSHDAALPKGQEWFDTLRFILYSFHMPAFVFVSGMLFGMSQRPFDGTYIATKAKRLLIPFLGIGFAVFAAKYAASAILPVDNFSRKPWWFAPYDLFIDTGHSPVRAIWFLVCYFYFIVIGAALFRRRFGLEAAIWGGFLLLLVPVPAVLYLNKFSEHFVYFPLGYAFVRIEDGRTRRYALPLLAAFVVVLALEPILGGPLHAWMPVAGILGSVALLNLVRLWQSDALAYVGRYTMVIYIFGSLVAGFTKALFVKAGLYGPLFSFYILLAVVLGVGVPILLRRWVIDRSPAVAPYFA